MFCQQKAKQILSSDSQLKCVVSTTAGCHRKCVIALQRFFVFLVVSRWFAYFAYCFSFFLEGQTYCNLNSEFVEKFAVWVSNCCSNCAKRGRNAQVIVIIIDSAIL